ncbi:hypothetical protein P4N68_08995 [Corynebacterium felinum]|uniref:Uncharacterized protein n=1 Tax=Corynebacterium felinum TaxID=131318 RepID=A0ABU2B6Y5_9CORY|nr:hypothetical protein [Corynebacterium felinum]MDF5821210.1 hypothetical protein [Corynebacterium felinum]MDR7353789.1 hypothetical protein [Corynebacterium felinum]WJY95968.1 hypothetical protein CFELI_11935 [Corynebacterium felinum]
MFKNRIRTAALAGAIAVATGLSGFSVPAFAQETAVTANAPTPPSQNVLNAFNGADGSLAVNVSAVNHTEDQLKAWTDATMKYLEALPKTELTVGAVVNDPSEQASVAALKNDLARATAELKTSADNITKARESVKYAVEKDQAAVDAWKAVAAKGDEIKKAEEKLAADFAKKVAEVNKLIQAANDVAGNTQPALPTFSDDSAEYADTMKKLNDRYDAAREQNADVDENNYIKRTYLPAFEKALAAAEAVKELLDPESTKIAELKKQKDDLTKAARVAQAEAQKSDAIVRQLLVNRATAQRDALRLVEAIYAATVRFAELYELDQDKNIVNKDGDNTTLRHEYRALVARLANSGAHIEKRLADAEEEMKKFGPNFATDLADPSAEAAELRRVQIAEANRVFAEVIANTEWQEDVAFLVNIDMGFNAEMAARMKAEEEAKARIKAEQDRAAKLEEILRKLAESQNKPAEPKPTTPAPTEKPGSGSSDNKDKKFPTWGIFAIIGGIVAAIAALFPMIAKHLNIKF